MTLVLIYLAGLAGSAGIGAYLVEKKGESFEAFVDGPLLVCFFWPLAGAIAIATMPLWVSVSIGCVLGERARRRRVKRENEQREQERLLREAGLS